jgi:hypothetical protein
MKGQKPPDSAALPRAAGAVGCMAPKALPDDRPLTDRPARRAPRMRDAPNTPAPTEQGEVGAVVDQRIAGTETTLPL